MLTSRLQANCLCLHMQIKNLCISLLVSKLIYSWRFWWLLKRLSSKKSADKDYCQWTVKDIFSSLYIINQAMTKTRFCKARPCANLTFTKHEHRLPWQGIVWERCSCLSLPPASFPFSRYLSPKPAHRRKLLSPGKIISSQPIIRFFSLPHLVLDPSPGAKVLVSTTYSSEPAPPAAEPGPSVADWRLSQPTPRTGHLGRTEVKSEKRARHLLQIIL